MNTENTGNRLTPEELLEAIKQEESRLNKGRLKIFLGMAAGVGKTFAMLEEAQQLKREGIHVMIGIVDPHGRQETAHLMEGLKIIPQKLIAYRDKEFYELDIDAILEIKPQLVLVDELAHTNIPGARHPKRWQDVMEILENGINVYTTLNVQHVESLNDVIRGITGVFVNETVPDLIIEKADSIQLVDLTPDELLQRLREGKVYTGLQSQVAIHHFFQKDRLTALREMALRYAAEKVDRDLHDMVLNSERVIEWKPREKFLVAVSASPYSQKLIRKTRRYASHSGAPWMAVYVNDGRVLNEEQNNQLALNLSLARNLGAEVITLNDPSIASAIQRIAHHRGITQIILGMSPDKSFLGIVRRITLVDQITAKCRDLDIHVIGQERKKAHKMRFKKTEKPPISQYILAILWVALLTGVSWLALPFIGYKVVGFIFLLGILSLSLFLKKGPIFFASLLYAAVWTFLFILPENQFAITQDDSALLVLYVITAIATGILADRAREHKEMLEKTEQSTQALYDIVRMITSTHSTSELFKSVKDRLGKLFHGSFDILVKLIDNGLPLDQPIFLLNDAKEKNAAIWVFENEKEAGWSTDTLPAIKNLYIPLKGYQEVVGLLIYRPNINRVLTPEEKNFLYTVCQQLAIHIERSFVDERTKQNEQLKQIEKMHRNILELIFQEFHQPLLDIQKNMKELKTKLEAQEEKGSLKEISQIETSMEGLAKTLMNISAMAQLSEGLIPLEIGLHDIRDLIEECCHNLLRADKTHQIYVKVEESLPLIAFDFYLIEILFFNLIRNAIEYTPSASKIEIEAKQSNGYLVISVSDEGEGIPQDQLEVIFEKFYRIPNTPSHGFGLGLSIAKTIAEIHHGYLKAENLPNKGARFSLFLPILTTLQK